MGELANEIGDMLSDYIPPEETEETDEIESEETSEEVEDVETETEQEEEDSEEKEQEESSEEESEESEETEDAEADEETEAEAETEDESDDDGRGALIEELNSVAAGKLDLGEDFDESVAEKENVGKDETFAGNGDQDNRERESSEQQQSQIDFDDVVSKPEVFQQAVSNIVGQIVEQKTQEILQNVTNIVGYQVQQQLSLKSLTDKFWQENDDLAEVKPYVAMVASTIQSKKPDMPIDQIFEKTSEIVRAKLRIKKSGGDGTSQTQTRRTKSKKPALVNSTRASRSTQTKPKQSKLEKDISDLIDF